ncbi:hypothetical protein E1218_21610 [Kribbella turkmenica]|uniref:Nuclear transport factor 2 family protein n=1 Tax=Kribbella turkmenica TaxID=2530375 RepID=A0A4R4WTC7_9ACTN|nr:hypothetical protein [Kribbella turkmenica]TDD20893.1 hypothetical protein E1218_21610 [Kribbella turkmenica]
MDAEELRELERQRLVWSVEGRVAEAHAVHADDFVIVTPSAIEISVGGRDFPELRAWHLDCYRCTATGWQLRWSQATAIT